VESRRKYTFEAVLLLAVFLWPVAASPAAPSADDSAQVCFSHALKSKQEGQVLEAERLFQKAIELEPENPDYHFELGNLYIEHNNLPGARIELEQATMINPSNVPALYNLGLVYRELGRMSDARHEFRRVLDLDPSNVKAQLQIGHTYQAEGFVEEARDAFQKAHEMDASDPEPQLALEDLGEHEHQAQARSERSREQSLLRNQQSLGLLGRSGSGTSAAQPTGREALVQAGAVLIQQLLARRAQEGNENQQAS